MPTLEDPYDRYRRQFERIQHAFRHPRSDDEQVIELACDDLAEPKFAYQRDHLVTRSDAANLEFMRDNFGATPVGEARFGTQLMKIGNRDARETVREVRRERGPQSAGLHHLLAVADLGDVNLCPADEPMPPNGEIQPELAPKGTGEGVSVRVIDTGLASGYLAHDWLAEVRGDERYPLAPERDIPLDYGHGTFVAGVLRRVAPAAAVFVTNALRRAGALTECQLRDALADIAEMANPPDIINLSAGGTSENGIDMMSLVDVVKKIHERGIVLVAAAGNNGNDTRFFPAAFPGVISVGAARQDARQGRACFSNYGDWVSIYAPGERLVNAFLTGDYRVKHTGRETCLFRSRGETGWYACCTCVDTLDEGTIVPFTGLARWSGTSFATPVVAGLIAARLAAARRADPQAKAQDAANWLLRHPAAKIDGMGPLVLPGQSLTSRCTGSDCDGDC